MKIRLLYIIFTGGILYSRLLSAQTQTPYSATTGNTVYSTGNQANTTVMNEPGNITGITPGQAVVGRCTRSSTGDLYALGYDSTTSSAELYTLTASGTNYTANPVSGTLANIDLGSNGNAVMHFVSGSDNNIRVVGRNGNNYILSANSGALAATGTNVISATQSFNDLVVYPNPVADQAKIALGVASTSKVYVDIIDMNGVVDRTAQYEPGSDVLLLDMSFLPDGLYSVRVYGSGIGQHNLEVVKQ